MHMSVPAADNHLKALGLFSEGEPCVLISHALIHALSGETDCAMAEVDELMRRFGLWGSQSGDFLSSTFNELLATARRAHARGDLSGVCHVAYKVAQISEAIASPTNRWAVGLEDRVGLERPSVLIRHFVGPGQRRKNPVPPLTGSEWARIVYGPVFFFQEA